MTNLALHLMDVPGSAAFGLWIFLSVGAVALFVVFLPITTWIEGQRKEREAFYKAETVRRLTEASGEGARAAVELIREQERIDRAKRREGVKIGGLINVAVGVALIVFLHMLIPYQAVYLCGLIPGFIGLAMLIYVFLMASKLE